MTIISWLGWCCVAAFGVSLFVWSRSHRDPLWQLITVLIGLRASLLTCWRCLRDSGFGSWASQWFWAIRDVRAEFRLEEVPRSEAEELEAMWRK